MSRSRRGGNAIEISLTLPVFLLVLFALMDYAWFFYHEAMSIEITRQGCRVGSVTPNFDAATGTPIGGDASPSAQAAVDFIEQSLIEQGLVTTVAINTDPASADGFVGVSATVSAATGTGDPDTISCDTFYEFVPLVGFLPVLPSEVGTSATYRLELP